MKRLFDALQIFLKYRDVTLPFTCICDELWVHGYPENEISPEDTQKLIELGFVWVSENNCWVYSA